jgi:uncharacterized protein YbcC (UPF0753/DUF2309 family)
MTTAALERIITDAQRMELRSYVQLASEPISQYWPMRTFIHHNPLHGLESLPFHEAVARGSLLFGGRDYLSNDTFRSYVNSGRIHMDEVRAALRPRALDKEITFAGRLISHLDVLSASMIHGITEDQPGNGARQGEEATQVPPLAAWLQRAVRTEHTHSSPPIAPWDLCEVLTRETLSTWCDETLGTSLVGSIDREIVKWCSVFLDEGETGWSMPHREQTFYGAWLSLAQHDVALRLLGVRNAAQKIRARSNRPEDAVLDSMTALGIPKVAWEAYLSLHLAALPGWTGYIKWRSNQTDFPWQRAFPIDLVQYLAVRLFYERELVERTVREALGMAGHYEAIRQYMDEHPYAYWVRREWMAGRLPKAGAKWALRLSRWSGRHDPEAWDEFGRQQYGVRADQDDRKDLDAAARSLIRLARALSMEPAALESTTPSDVRTVLTWLREFPASRHGPYWLEAFEAGPRRRLLDDLSAAGQTATDLPLAKGEPSTSLAQIVFCIDVRSEVFRRHLEQRGGYETLGLAGFFGVPLDYQPFAAHYKIAHCPVLLKPKNQVREVPRSYHGALAERHKTAAQLSEAAHTLLHDLKENPVTPYVMVEAIGWLFSLPMFGKTLLPRAYHKASQWLKRLLLPSVATTLTVDKLTREEAEEMIAAEHRALIRGLVRERLGPSGAVLSPTLLEKIRKKALGPTDGINGEIADALRLTSDAEETFFQELRERYRISPRGLSERLEEITRMGFTDAEQAYFVEAALRLMGLTSNFARIVLFCAHGSTSDNNPYESALDCGACGGNQGLPNARVIAAMANKLVVRELLQTRGIKIPNGTHFLAAQHDTTTDRVRIVDLEDVPATHRKDLTRLMGDLEEAGTQAALERGLALGLTSGDTDVRAARHVAARRSQDWSETRPEWGLSGNSVMVIGRRALTQTVNLHGRAFLHSYDHAQDPSGKLLQTIMTAPLVVAQWINMEHYFSTVDNEVYGSGSKVYHNVVGRIGVMTGVSSDLRIGLPAQTVLNGRRPYHDPMRLLALIQAPRDRIQTILERHSVLQQLFHQRWVTLVALEPRDGRFYYYEGQGSWK